MRTVVFIFCFCLLPLVLPRALGADVDSEKLAKVKAAFVLNFVKFTTWPEEAFEHGRSPLRVVVIGPDDLGAILDATFQGRKYMDRSITVRRLPRLPTAPEQRSSALAELQQEHLIYCAGDELRSDDLAVLNRSAVLLVGAQSAYLRRGSLLAFGIADGRVVFHYNAEAGKASPLKLSSKLLTLARPVD